MRLLARRLVTLGPTVNIGYANDLAVSLAMLTAVIADLRTAQHHAAQAAAARRASSRRPDAPPARVWTDNGARARLRCSRDGLPGRTHRGPAIFSGAPDTPPSTPTQGGRTPRATAAKLAPERLQSRPESVAEA